MEYKEDSYPKHIQSRFEKLEVLGSGAYGYVWKVREKKTNEIYALKKVFLAFQNDLDAQRTFRQISILKQTDHPNVVKLVQVIKAENDIDLFLVFEYVQCDLFRAIKDNVLNDTHRKYVTFQIVKTLVYLHSAGIVHRDLKPSNILIDSSCKIKICDFGLSRSLYCYEGENPNMTEFIATRWYRAPEVLFGSTCYNQKSDLWSLGCLIYEIYCAKTLLPGKDSVHQIQKLLEFKGYPDEKQIKDLKVDRLQNLLSHFSIKQLPEKNYFDHSLDHDLITLLKGLLVYSPEKRWNLQKILSCKFLSEFKNYEPIVKASKPIILKINDNIKNNKQFYRNFIYKVYVKKRSSLDLKCLPISQHSSLSKSKRGCLTTGRKSFDSLGSILSSFHKKFISKSKEKTDIRVMRKSVDDIIRHNRSTTRNKKQIESPYAFKLKRRQDFSKQKLKMKSQFKGFQSILKEISNKKKELNKQQSRKVLKRKAFAFLI